MRLLKSAVAATVILSISAAAVLAAPTSSAPPTVAGKPVYGKTVRCERGTWSPDAVSFSYRWGASEFDTKARGASWKIDEVGYGISCFVTATDAAGATTTAQSAAFTVIDAEPKLNLRVRPSGPNRITVAGRVTPREAARPDDGRQPSLVLYREKGDASVQLTYGFNRPKRDGTFVLKAGKVPPGRHTFVVQFAPVRAGFDVVQATIRARVAKR